MKKLLIIPDRNHIAECIKLAKQYDLGFEYNDFFNPQVLDDEGVKENLITEYVRTDSPAYTTLHGAFYDVIPFSLDKKIKQVSELRIEQSIETAKKLGAKAVVFHTNYNPLLGSEVYFSMWLESNIEYWSLVLEKHSDINIYLENMFERSSKELAQLAKELSVYSNFGICLDYAHAFLSGTDLKEWVETLGKYVKHIHINDNDGNCDQHLAWGDGSICRFEFYEFYEKYMNGATILVETNTMENKIRSIERLKEDGFF